jgi:hypothetical protein
MFSHVGGIGSSMMSCSSNTVVPTRSLSASRSKSHMICRARTDMHTHRHVRAQTCTCTCTHTRRISETTRREYYRRTHQLDVRRHRGHDDRDPQLLLPRRREVLLPFRVHVLGPQRLRAAEDGLNEGVDAAVGVHGGKALSSDGGQAIREVNNDEGRRHSETYGHTDMDADAG